MNVKLVEKLDLRNFVTTLFYKYFVVVFHCHVSTAYRQHHFNPLW